jgi:hypothetical protein
MEGKNIFRGKDLTEFDQNDTYSKKRERFDDVETDEEKLSQIEKTPLQKEVVEHAINFIEDHMKSLGLEPRPYETKRIVFWPFHHETLGTWYKSDWIIIQETAEGNVGVVTHELLHAISSEWYYRTPEFIETLPENRKIKSGFHSNWAGKSELLELDTIKPNFHLLNEAITEKISQEITLTHAEYANEVLEKSREKLDYHLNEIERKKQNAIKEALESVEETKKEIAQEEEKDILEKEQEMSKLISEGYPQEFIDNMRGMKQRSLERRRELWKKHVELRQDFVDFREKMYEGIKESTISIFEKPLQSSAYKEGIKILELVLEGLAKKEGGDFKETKKKIWFDLQKAYFNGNVMWLRKIDQVFNEGTLKKIGLLSNADFDKVIPKITEELEKKVRELS